MFTHVVGTAMEFSHFHTEHSKCLFDDKPVIFPQRIIIIISNYRGSIADFGDVNTRRLGITAIASSLAETRVRISWCFYAVVSLLQAAYFPFQHCQPSLLHRHTSDL